MGHALDNTLQDILIRYKRMQGYNALWIPGSRPCSNLYRGKSYKSDCKEEGIDKKELGREGFLEENMAVERRVSAGTIEQPVEEAG